MRPVDDCDGPLCSPRFPLRFRALPPLDQRRDALRCRLVAQPRPPRGAQVARRLLQHHRHEALLSRERARQARRRGEEKRRRARRELDALPTVRLRFKVFQERFVSKVTLHPHELIDVEYVNGPFRYLNNHWRFIEADDGGCTIDFYVDFEFRSKVLQKLIGLLFNEAVSRMVGAFEARANQLYGAREQPAPEAEEEPARPAASRA